jgi:hypothetical protein
MLFRDTAAVYIVQRFVMLEGRFSTWEMRIPKGSRRHLMVYEKTSCGVCEIEIKYYFMRNVIYLIYYTCTL